MEMRDESMFVLTIVFSVLAIVLSILAMFL
jgi:hypothetical protein